MGAPNGDITMGVAPIISIIANKIILAVNISLKSIAFMDKLTNYN